MTYSSIASIFVLLFGGVIYDLFGRKFTVTIMFALCAASTAPMPFGIHLQSESAQVGYITAMKVIYSCCFIPLIMNPFINDYVKVQDRGLAMGLQNTGLTMGSIFSVAGLYTLTSMLKAEYAFPLLAVV